MWESNFGFFRNNKKELFELCEGSEIMLNKNSNMFGVPTNWFQITGINIQGVNRR